MDAGRKEFLKKLGYLSAGIIAAPGLAGAFNRGGGAAENLFFDISLAQWSLHKAYFGNKLDPLYFARTASEEYGIKAVEYVNQFYKGKAKDQKYLSQLKDVADSEGVYSHLIMCDGEGDLGNPNDSERQQAVENHYKWIEAAKFLDCRTIRVNARGQSGYSYEDQLRYAADGFRKLCEFSEPYGIYIVLENHGGISSNGQWVADLMEETDHPLCGTLPDFGNFDISDTETYDRYKGVKEMMPYARGVSAKSYDFNDQGEETTIDYMRMLKIVRDAGFEGYIGIEYEGSRLSENEGIIATKKLLERAGKTLTKG